MLTSTTYQLSGYPFRWISLANRGLPGVAIKEPPWERCGWDAVDEIHHAFFAGQKAGPSGREQAKWMHLEREHDARAEHALRKAGELREQARETGRFGPWQLDPTTWN